MISINILMCGGRRIGKTSIMAAIQKNVQDMFPKGDIVLDMENANSLVLYRTEQENIFGSDHEEELTYIAAQTPTLEKSIYRCRVYLKDRKSNMELLFTDIPGEWFINSEYQEELIELIRNSQVLLIAVDSPHLVEKEGRYHDVFNRAAILTEEIQKAFQGTGEQRMVLFAPLKCERYKNRERMEEVMEQVKAGYQDLIDYLCAPERKNLFTVAITPVITMGGVEFLRFLKPVDEDGSLVCTADGKPLEPVSVNPGNGQLEMNWLAEYRYLVDGDGDHFYEPSDCEQPLLYILLFLIGIGRQRGKGILKGIWASIFRLPNQEIMDSCIQDLVEKRMSAARDGFAIINDPMCILGKK